MSLYDNLMVIFNFTSYSRYQKVKRDKFLGTLLLFLPILGMFLGLQASAQNIFLNPKLKDYTSSISSLGRQNFFSNQAPANLIKADLLEKLDTELFTTENELCKESQNLTFYGFNDAKPSLDVENGFDNSQSGIYQASKSEIDLLAKQGNVYFYGQKMLNPATINYISCILKSTHQDSLRLLPQIELYAKDFSFLPTRVLIYDSFEQYSFFYGKAYGQNLGDVTPWGLTESNTISTFLDLDQNNLLNDNYLQNLKFRLTLNISHEYFHRLFHELEYGYRPFFEEGLATFMAMKQIDQMMGEQYRCFYVSMQSNLAQKPHSLKNLDWDKITNATDWRQQDSESISQRYALAFFYIQDLDKKQKLTSFLNDYRSRATANYTKTHNFQDLATDIRQTKLNCT
jgi:hypothetical protein